MRLRLRVRVRVRVRAGVGVRVGRLDVPMDRLDFGVHIVERVEQARADVSR